MTLVGRTQEKCDGARARVQGGLNRVSKRRYPNDPQSQQQFVQGAMSKLDLATDLNQVDLEKTDIVVEAVVEDLKLKQDLFHKLEQSTSQ